MNLGNCVKNAASLHPSEAVSQWKRHYKTTGKRTLLPRVAPGALGVDDAGRLSRMLGTPD
jgi:hypothetical protein